MTTPPVPTLAPVFDVRVTLEAPLEFGATSAGGRRIIPITGGEITGALEAEILPGGADWQRVRADGSLEIDGRYTARTREGELVYLSVRGLRTGPAEVLAALGHGEDVDPGNYYFRTSVTFEASTPRLAWLQDALFIASCIREARAVRYTAYRVS
ncbi:DUF3237 domain-containing protein [Microbacterium sp. KR10-403]|uniref:DUF3237 domain-containing protein n=1 Tax=Microbacterium sp. KR10-403 TaxID=3158581 RepID=UPI0032E46780